MKSNTFYIPPQGPPGNIRPNSEIYQKMGEKAVRNMIADFYEELGRSVIADMFSKNRSAAVDRSAAFFVFILGGPPLYHEQYGPPMMRQRHLPFAIDESARQIWLECFHRVLVDCDKKYGFPLEHLEGFLNFLDKFSAWMVNTK